MLLSKSLARQDQELERGAYVKENCSFRGGANRSILNDFEDFACIYNTICRNLHVKKISSDIPRAKILRYQQGIQLSSNCDTIAKASCR